MKIVISGGHSRTDYLVAALRKEKHDVVVINSDLQACRTLRKAYKDITIIHGEPFDLSVLESINLKNTDVSVALMQSDDENFVVSMLLKRHYNAEHALSIVNNPENIELFEHYGVSKVVDLPKLLAMTIVDRLHFDDIRRVKPFEDRKTMMYELPVRKGTGIIGQRVRDVNVPKGAHISALFRGEETLVPDETTVIEQGDTVLVVSIKPNETDIRESLVTHEDA